MHLQRLNYPYKQLLVHQCFSTTTEAAISTAITTEVVCRVHELHHLLIKLTVKSCASSTSLQITSNSKNLLIACSFSEENLLLKLKVCAQTLLGFQPVYFTCITCHTVIVLNQGSRFTSHWLICPRYLQPKPA